MEILPDIAVLAALAGAALLAGFVDAIAGGGGLILLPALLTAGLPPHLALGTNKLSGSFGTFNALRVYVQRGVFDFTLWRGMLIATGIGALTGALCASILSTDRLRQLLPVVVLAAGVYVAFSPNSARAYQPMREKPLRLRSSGLGLGLGFYDGIAGPGAGAFWTALAMRLFHTDLLNASAIARAMNFVSNVAALAVFYALGHVHVALGLLLGCALFGGAQIGVHSALRYGRHLIKPVFLCVVFVLTGKLVIEEWL